MAKVDLVSKNFWFQSFREKFSNSTGIRSLDPSPIRSLTGMIIFNIFIDFLTLLTMKMLSSANFGPKDGANIVKLLPSCRNLNTSAKF